MKLTEEQHNILVDWIERYFIPIKIINTKVDTSHIREAFINTYEYGFYLDNDSINNVMLELGYHATNFSHNPYLNFNISNQSPALREYRRRALSPLTYEKYE